MDKTLYFPDMHVLTDDLNNTEDTKEQQIKRRQQAGLGNAGGHGVPAQIIARGGVFGNPQDRLQNKNLRPYYSGPEIIVYSGSALISTGELVTIPDNSYVTLSPGTSTYNTEWDTSGGDGTYFLKISPRIVNHQNKTDDFGNVYPTRRIVEFKITANKENPTDNDVLLATFVNAGGVISDFVDKRQYVRTLTTANAVSNDPVSVTGELIKTTQDHMNAVGSGTATLQNPHGLTGPDIGVETLEHHLKESHVSGILFEWTNTSVLTSAMTNSYAPAIIDGGLNVSFAERNNAFMMVDGSAFKDNLDTLSGSGAPDQSDSYYIVAVGTSTPEFRKINDVPGITTNPERYPDLCLLARVDVALNVITNLVDLRKFYTLNPPSMRADFLESNESASATLPRHATLHNSLNRIRRQLGRAIDGSGTGWNATSVPLTAGVNSNVDQYHRHSTSWGPIFRINNIGTNDAALVVNGAAHEFGFKFDFVNSRWVAQSWQTEPGTRARIPIEAHTLKLSTVAANSKLDQSISEFTGPHIVMLTSGPQYNANTLHTHGLQTLANSVLEDDSNVLIDLENIDHDLYRSFVITGQAHIYKLDTPPEWFTLSVQLGGDSSVNYTEQYQMIGGNLIITKHGISDGDGSITIIQNPNTDHIKIVPIIQTGTSAHIHFTMRLSKIKDTFPASGTNESYVFLSTTNPVWHVMQSFSWNNTDKYIDRIRIAMQSDDMGGTVRATAGSFAVIQGLQHNVVT